jgi:hypothetical protein
MFNIATKKRYTLGKTIVRELSSAEGNYVGGGVPRGNLQTAACSVACGIVVPKSKGPTITPSNPPPGGIPPNGSATTVNTNQPLVSANCNPSIPSVCICTVDPGNTGTTPPGQTISACGVTNENTRSSTCSAH